jgi:hypothetical protein
MRMRWPVLVAATLAAGTARAIQVEIVAVMWQQDLSAKSTVEDFFACLVESSTFGTTWAKWFGLDQVSWRGVYVLSDPCPTSAHLGGNLPTILSAAFDTGNLPKPSTGGTSYLLYLPKGVQGYDPSEIPACMGTYCGVHGPQNYNGTRYDAALVPIDCPDCGSAQVTLTGEHEAAEAIARMGTAQYEVGDFCERKKTMLACCGKMYPIQQLASPYRIDDCHTIDATGNMCWCAPDGATCFADGDCCGGHCNVAARSCGAPPDLEPAPMDLATPPMDMAVATSDAAAPGGGDNGGGGNGCEIAAHADGGAWLLALTLLYALARRFRADSSAGRRSSSRST